MSNFNNDNSSNGSGGGVSEGLAITCAIAAPLLYAINGILDKTAIAIRVRYEYSYIAMVGCVDMTLGYNSINIHYEMIYTFTLKITTIYFYTLIL